MLSTKVVSVKITSFTTKKGSVYFVIRGKSSTGTILPFELYTSLQM